MKDGKECEIKLDIPVQLQLQLNSPKEIRRDSKALLPGTGTEITNSPHPLQEYVPPLPCREMKH